MLIQNLQRHFQWTYEEVGKTRRPEPYDRISEGNLRELDATDGSTAFLFRHIQMDEDTGYFIYLAIEAPRGCPMREAFEWGELTWDEYLTHRPFLYRLTIPFNPGPVITTQITPQEIPPFAMKRFRQMGDNFPYEFKRQQLELTMKHASLPRRDPIKAKKEYEEFMARFDHRFAARKAA